MAEGEPAGDGPANELIASLTSYITAHPDLPITMEGVIGDVTVIGLKDYMEGCMAGRGSGEDVL